MAELDFIAKDAANATKTIATYDAGDGKSHSFPVLSTPAGAAVPLPAALGAGGGLKIDGSGTPLPVSVSATITIDSELAAAALAADGAANPTAPFIQSALSVFNGTTWDRLRGTTAGVSTKEARSATGAQSNVSGSASDVTVLASNANRLGATVFNDSTAILYLLLANATSSATVYTVQLAAGSYYEVPFNYTGVIKGIWASAAGSARVTELT